MMIRLVLFIFVFLFLSGCNPVNTGNKANPLPMATQSRLSLREEALEDIILNIPSPHKALFVLINEYPEGVSSIHEPVDINTLWTDSELKNSFTLGRLYTKAGYACIINNNYQREVCFEAAQVFSERLNIPFSISVDKLTSFSSNPDSLINFSIQYFNDLIYQLHTNNKSHIGSILITGAWMESLCILSELIDIRISKELVEILGNQKLLLNNLIILTDQTCRNNSEADFIKDDLKILQKAFNHVNISYESTTPRAIENKGMLIIRQEEEREVKVSSETLELIRKSINKVCKNL